VATIYAFSNQKGGVGKTTSAINLAAGLAARGHRILLVDLDAQGNATSGLGIDKNALPKTVYQAIIGNATLQEVIVQTDVENLDLVPANADLAGAEIELVSELGREMVLKKALNVLLSNSEKETYEFIFIDCPPSLGLLTLNALVAADKLVIPLQCEYYALEGLGQLVNTFELVKDRLNPKLEIGGVILTMADFRTKLTTEVIQEVRKHFGSRVYQSVIPRSVKLSEAPSYGKPAVLYDRHNRGVQGYLALAKEFEGKEGKPVEKEAPRVAPEATAVVSAAAALTPSTPLN